MSSIYTNIVQANDHHDGSQVWRDLSLETPSGSVKVSCFALRHDTVEVNDANNIRAPMTFFSTTDTGVTLNRFSQDLQLIDMELPVAALNTFASRPLLPFIPRVYLLSSHKHVPLNHTLCHSRPQIIRPFNLQTPPLDSTTVPSPTRLDPPS